MGGEEDLRRYGEEEEGEALPEEASGRPRKGGADERERSHRHKERKPRRTEGEEGEGGGREKEGEGGEKQRKRSRREHEEAEGKDRDRDRDRDRGRARESSPQKPSEDRDGDERGRDRDRKRDKARGSKDGRDSRKDADRDASATPDKSRDLPSEKGRDGHGRAAGDASKGSAKKSGRSREEGLDAPAKPLPGPPPLPSPPLALPLPPPPPPPAAPNGAAASDSGPGTDTLAERLLKAKEQRQEQRQQQQQKQVAVPAPRGDSNKRGGRTGGSRQEDEDDMSAWVAKSRILGEKRKEEREKAERMALMLAEQDERDGEDEDEEEDEEGGGGGGSRPRYTSRDLAGLKVRDGVEQVLDEGAAVVLTLKDSSILADGELNEGEDELENVEIAELKSRQAAYKAAKQPNKIEDKFVEEMEGTKRMLPQYDESPGGEGAFTLDGRGGLGDEVKARLEKVKQRMQATAAGTAPAGGSSDGSGAGGGTGVPASKGAGRVLVGMGASKPQGDYFTPEEMAQFKKPKVKKEKKLRRRRGGGQLDLDELEKEARAAGLGGAGDMGTRSGAGEELARRRREEGEREEQARLSRYQAAMAKEQESSRVLRQGREGSLGREEGGEGEGGEAQGMEVDGEAGQGGRGAGAGVGGGGGGEGGMKREEGEEDEGLVIGDEDEDSDLQRSLARARQVALKQQQQEMQAGVKEEAMDVDEAPPAFNARALKGAEGEAAVLARLARLPRVKQEAEEQGPASEGLAGGGAGASGGTAGGGLVFTDTGEFCRGLQVGDGAGAGGRRGVGGAQSVVAGQGGGMTSVSTGAESGVRSSKAGMGAAGEAAEKEKEKEKESRGGWMEVSAEGTAAEEEGGEEEEAEEGVEEEPLPEAQVGKGLAGALALLKDRGSLKDEIEWGGRTMDKKRSKLLGVVDEEDVKSLIGGGSATRQDWPREVSLDRRDEFGRIMTPKEAFRKMSHKFHGKAPGKMKQEKRLKAYDEELKRKSMAAGDTPLHSVEKLREVQEQISSPYIVISGHIKPGQISDPRSGFAMSEREPSAGGSGLGAGTATPRANLGNLTPMLGDKKVEHFLGMSKQDGGASMGPPAARLPKK